MRIIFHHPLPLDPNAKSASGIRPQRMLKAFRDLGYEVDLVVGYASERKRSIKYIKNKIQKGMKYDFMYAESSTLPNVLTEQNNLPTHPFMDWLFFRFCKKQNIPIGLFYRDIYWLFENFQKRLNPTKLFAAKLAYRFDLWVYEQTVTKLYLPSLAMSKYVPIVSHHKFETLAPGHTNPETMPREKNKEISLFYVGGVSSHYQLHLLFEILTDYPQIHFTLCTRDSEWQKEKNNYPSVSKNISIIHKSGPEMEEQLKTCDVAVLYVKPQKYWEFAAPVKLYEYLGFEKPILASRGTLAGDFVRDNNIGWCVEYNQMALRRFFEQLISDPSFLDDVHTCLPKVAKQHSWLARAKQVSHDLMISVDCKKNKSNLYGC